MRTTVASSVMMRPIGITNAQIFLFLQVPLGDLENWLLKSLDTRNPIRKVNIAVIDGWVVVIFG